MDASIKKKILVVDDESRIADMISDFCIAFGFETKILNGGKNIVEVIKSYSPDLITLDLLMPGLSGFEILRELKANEETKSIPIVIISSIASTISAEEVSKKCLGILSKPLKMQNLKQTLEKALSI